MTQEQLSEIVDRSKRWSKQDPSRVVTMLRVTDGWICVLMDDSRRFGIEAAEPDKALDLAIRRWASEEN